MFTTRMKNNISPAPLNDDEPSDKEEQATPLCKVSLSLAVVAVVVHSVGLACPFWLVGAAYIPPYGLNRINAGVFQGCSDFGGCGSKGDTAQWQKAAAALEVIAEIIGVVDVVMLFIAMFFTKTGRNWRRLKIASIIMALFAASFMVISLSLYGANANSLVPGVQLSISWAYVLVCVSAIVYVLSGVCFIIELAL